MNDKLRCCVRIYGTGYSFKGSPCTKPVRITVDGKHYCAIHDPAKVAERRAKVQAKANARQEARNAHYEVRKETERRAACFDTLVAACRAAQYEVATALHDYQFTSEKANNLNAVLRQLETALSEARNKP